MKNVKTWKCGSNHDNSYVTATLKGNTLFINGDWSMKNYGYSNNVAPWYKESITHVVIGDNVTAIGDYAFSGLRGLKSIVIGESVKIIGERAFNECHILESVNIPNSVENIRSFAFASCKALKSITIPESVRDLSTNIFSGCDMLETIVNESIVPQYVSINCSYTVNNSINTSFIYYEIYGRIDNLSDRVKLFVPASALDLYKNTSIWESFTTILPLEDNVELRSIEQIDKEIHILEIEKAAIEIKLAELLFKKVLLRGLKGNPKHVAEFMALFNQRDGLKYLTHDIDGSDDFDYDKVLSLVRNVCTENFEEKEIPSTLRELLNQFIFEEKPLWKSFDKDYNELEIKSGWSASDWQDTRNSNLHPIRQPQFAEFIRSFKRLTRIESPYLETLVNKVFADDNLEIETKDLSKADFYTHVGEFKAALETIFAEIQKRADADDKKKVSVAYKREISDDFFVRKIIITHHNSFPTRDDKDALLKEWLSFEKGCMAKIAEHLQGYCHWSVETCIDDEPVRVNILREQETEPHETIDRESVDGFSHVLTFYYQ